MPKILIIDDNFEVQTFLSSVIKKRIPNSSVRIASSGLDGIEKAKNELPDTILLDIKMGNMDGFEVCHQLKSTEETKHIPVIILTGIMTDTKSRIKGLDIGADAFLTKPIETAALVAQVNVMLRIKRADDRLRDEKEWLKNTAHESEEKYRLMFEKMVSGFAIIRIVYDHGRPVDYVYLDVNPAHEKHTGIKGTDILGKTGTEVISGLKKEWIETLARVDQTGDPIESEYYFEGLNSWLKIFAYRPQTGLVAVSFENITERKLAENELMQSREQLRSLSVYLQSVREEERTLIARELHDELGQTLTALKIDLSCLNEMLPRELETAINKIDTMSEIISDTIQFTKKMVSDLRPSILDNLGLTAAIEWQAKEFQKRTGINCNLNLGLNNIKLDQDLATALFRIFQETLTNVARHADATDIDMNLIQKDNNLELTVVDNGKGISDERIANPKSFGLIGIRERVLQFGGKYNINGINKQGTAVSVSVPIK